MSATDDIAIAEAMFAALEKLYETWKSYKGGTITAADAAARLNAVVAGDRADNAAAAAAIDAKFDKAP